MPLGLAATMNVAPWIHSCSKPTIKTLNKIAHECYSVFIVDFKQELAHAASRDVFMFHKNIKDTLLKLMIS